MVVSYSYCRITFLANPFVRFLDCKPTVLTADYGFFFLYWQFSGDFMSWVTSRRKIWLSLEGIFLGSFGVFHNAATHHRIEYLLIESPRWKNFSYCRGCYDRNSICIHPPFGSESSKESVDSSVVSSKRTLARRLIGIFFWTMPFQFSAEYWKYRRNQSARMRLSCRLTLIIINHLLYEA